MDKSFKILLHLPNSVIRGTLVPYTEPRLCITIGLPRGDKASGPPGSENNKRDISHTSQCNTNDENYFEK